MSDLTHYLRAKNTYCCSLYLLREKLPFTQNNIWFERSRCAAAVSRLAEDSLWICSTSLFLMFELCFFNWDCGPCCPGNSVVSSFVPGLWEALLHQLWILAAWTKIGFEKKCEGPGIYIYIYTYVHVCREKEKNKYVTDIMLMEQVSLQGLSSGTSLDLHPCLQLLNRELHVNKICN